jgi:hypothetical protein
MLNLSYISPKATVQASPIHGRGLFAIAPIAKMECRCGAATCRKIVTGKDWQKPELQEKYAGYMSWYLAERIKRQRS